MVFTVTVCNYFTIKDTVLLKIFDGSKRPYMHMTGVNYGVDEKKTLIEFVPLYYMLSNYLKAFLYYFDEAMGKYNVLESECI